MLYPKNDTIPLHELKKFNFKNVSCSWHIGHLKMLWLSVLLLSGGTESEWKRYMLVTSQCWKYVRVLVWIQLKKKFPGFCTVWAIALFCYKYRFSSPVCFLLMHIGSFFCYSYTDTLMNGFDLEHRAFSHDLDRGHWRYNKSVLYCCATRQWLGRV